MQLEVEKVNVLLVDDHPGNLLALEAILDPLGQNLVKAGSGIEALRCLLQQDFAVILIDVQMPEMDGFETAALIRERSRSRHTPIIFLTAFSKSDDFVFEGYSQGAVDYLFKPIEPKILTSKIVVFVDLYKNTRSLNRQTAKLLAVNAELKESEERLQDFLNNANDLIQIISPDGTFNYVNRAWKQALGYSEKAIEQLTYFDIIHPDSRPQVKAIVKSVQPGQSCRVEIMLLTQDGRAIPVEGSLNCRIEAGEARTWGILHHISERKHLEAVRQQLHDELEVRVEQRTSELSKTNEKLQREITERKQAEAALHSSMATNRALLNAIPDLMFRINRAGTFINFKAAKEDDLLVPPSEFLGRHLYEVFPPEIAQPAMECVEQALNTGDIQVFEYQLPHSSQDELLNLRDYEARIVVSAEDEVIAITRDITERKRAEANIHKALEKETELGELKSRFVSMTSHEFRTPLTTILSSAELLEVYSHKWGEEKKLTHFQRIQVAVKQMTGLLDDVLLIGKAEAGKLEFKPTYLNLAQFCGDLVEEIQLSAAHPTNGSPAHAIAFVSQGQCTNVCLDEKLLRHILSNLLSNAVKYSPQGGTVHFDLMCNSEEVTFQVRDEGIGIPVADQAQLFNSFHRASNVGAIAGTGLGLAIVKKSVDLHRGKIAVKSEVGFGTTFTVKIPLNH